MGGVSIGNWTVPADYAVFQVGGNAAECFTRLFSNRPCEYSIAVYLDTLIQYSHLSRTCTRPSSPLRFAGLHWDCSKPEGWDPSSIAPP